MGAKRSAAMVEALRLVMHEGASAADASRVTGITKGAISLNADYRLFVECGAQPATLRERTACYNARRVLRSTNPARFAKLHKFDADPLVVALVDELPRFLAVDCIAAADRKALTLVRMKGIK